MEFCENCFEEVSNVINYKGTSVCKSCIKDMKASNTSTVGVLDSTDDLVGVETDQDVIDYYSDIANYQNSMDSYY